MKEETLFSRTAAQPSDQELDISFERVCESEAVDRTGIVGVIRDMRLAEFATIFRHQPGLAKGHEEWLPEAIGL